MDDNLYFRLSNLYLAARKATTNLMRAKQRDANDNRDRGR